MDQTTVQPPPAQRRSEIGVLLLRVFFGFVLIYGTQDNVFSADRMQEFRDFLENHGFPYPLASAYLSAYAQFLGGLLILLGAATRLAAMVMVVNFAVALVMVHVGLPFSANIAPLSMLFLAVFFSLHGAGTWSIDASSRVRGIARAGGFLRQNRAR